MSEQIMRGNKVVLAQVLNARERRAYLQMQILQKYGHTLLCFTMNIAGPVKNNAMIHRGFQSGLRQLKGQLLRIRANILYEYIIEEDTGNEAFLAIDADPFKVKEASCFLEDEEEMGRLYDMDVLYLKDGIPTKLDREEIQKSGRTCLICGKPAKECSSRRVHSVEELQRKTMQILEGGLLLEGKEQTARHAVRSLLYEVTVTPKPGLVDRNNSGSHNDMDFYTFLNSASALYPYFSACYEEGWKGKDSEAEETFRILRTHGIKAEREMLLASDGVNTHKGAIFSMGILSAAIGRYDAQRFTEETYEEHIDIQEILDNTARICEGLISKDLEHLHEKKQLTAGEKLYVEHGITGVRGMAEAGFPILRDTGYPLLKQLLGEGYGFDEAGGMVLLAILSRTTDTNMISRSDLSTLVSISDRLRTRLQESEGVLPQDEVREMDRQFIAKHLSPGGSADLLAMCFMLYFTERGE